MANPLNGRGGYVGAGPFSGMVQGETRTHIFPDGRMLRLTRTSREFVYDWVDAANEADRESLNARGLMWVAQNGATTLREVRHLSDRDKATIALTRRMVPALPKREPEPA